MDKTLNTKNLINSLFFSSLLLWIISIDILIYKRRFYPADILTILASIVCIFSFLLYCLQSISENEKEIWKKWKWFLVLDIGIYAILLLLIIIKKDEYPLAYDHVRHSIVISNLARYLVIQHLVNIVIVTAILNTKYLEIKNQRRSLIEWLFFLSVAISLLLMTYLLSYLVLYGRIGTSMINLWELILIFAFMLYPIFLIKNSMQRKHIRLRRRVVYSSATFVYLGVYFILLGIMSKIMAIMNVNLNLFFEVILTVGLLLGFVIIAFSETVKARMRSFIDMAVYHEKYDYQQIWEEFNDKIFAASDIDGLIEEMAVFIKEKLKLTELKLFLADKFRERVYYKVDFDNHEIEKGDEIELQKDLFQWIVNYGRPFYLNELSELELNLELPIKRENLKTEQIVFSALVNRKNLIGFLVCWTRDGFRLSLEEMKILEQLSTGMAVSMSNFLLAEELIEAREIQSYNRLAAFLFHDIKNILSGLNLILENAKGKIQDPRYQVELLNSLENTVKRMFSLVEKLKFAKVDKQSNFLPSSIGNVLRRIIAEMKLDSKKDIRLETVIKDTPDPLLIDAEGIHRVICNLILNALDAMPNGGKLFIRAFPASRHYQIEVEDTGKGMTSQFINQNLFKPFASTKKNGLGIGLYQSREIIRAHGGTIQVKSKVNSGTTFTVRIPMNMVQKNNIFHGDIVENEIVHGNL